jgi:hypothetical protein
LCANVRIMLFTDVFFCAFIQRCISPAIFKIESDPVKVADTVNEVNSNKTSTM